MKTKQTIATVFTAAALALQPLMAEKPEEKKPEQAKVQIAILLDTSSSMSGLIEQTKTQLWKIVNTFIDAKQNGQVPFVEVALYEYGKSSLTKDEHWIRQIQPLTRDLDEISKQLFALNTNGGDEYCGAVIQRAIADLKWDTSSHVYKAIFIAGNEPFTQGPIDPNDAVKSAISKGVIVNTIHCGNEQAGISGGWKNGAMLADGQFLTIDHNRAVVHIEAPQDAEIVKLSAELNKTYIAYGKRGVSKKLEQAAQDNNAAEKAKSGAAVQRTITKSSKNYSNASWCLVDASQEKDFDITKVKKEDLPKELQSMTMEQRKEYVAEKAKERAAIQAKIMALNKERMTYVSQKRQEMAEKEGKTTLDEVVAQTVRDQAQKKGYVFGQ